MTAPALEMPPQPQPADPPKKKHAGGRPTKLTDETMARVLAELSRGVFLSIAFKLAGVSVQQGYAWIKAGREARKGTRLRQFSESCALAIATAEAKLGDVVWDAATKQKSAKIALAMLGRRFPERWSARRHLEGEVKHKHEGQLAHIHGVVMLPAEDLGKDSLPVEQVLARQKLGQGLANARIATVPPPNAQREAGDQDPGDRPATQPLKPWNPGKRAPGAVTSRAKELLREMGQDLEEAE